MAKKYQKLARNRLAKKSNGKTDVELVTEAPDDVEKAKKKPKKKTVAIRRVVIPEPKIIDVRLTLVGITALICHRFGPTTYKAIKDKQTGQAVEARGPRVPEDEYRDSLYELPDGGYGFPAQAFKRAAVSACSSLKGVLSMAQAKQSHAVLGDDGCDGLVRIKGKPRMHEAPVRIGRSSVPRFRAQFFPWSLSLRVRLWEQVMSIEQLLNLYNTAGFAVGVGDWRPERNGSNGQYKTTGGEKEGA